MDLSVTVTLSVCLSLCQSLSVSPSLPLSVSLSLGILVTVAVFRLPQSVPWIVASTELTTQPSRTAYALWPFGQCGLPLLSVCLSVSLCARLSLCLSLSLPACLSLSVCLLLCLLLCLCLPACLSVCLSVSLQCPLCKGEAENDVHLLATCGCHDPLRQRYLSERLEGPVGLA